MIDDSSFMFTHSPKDMYAPLPPQRRASATTPFAFSSQWPDDQEQRQVEENNRRASMSRVNRTSSMTSEAGSSRGIERKTKSRSGNLPNLTSM